MDRRVVVTGVGAITPLGNNIETTWEAVVEGRSGIKSVKKFTPDGLDSQVAGQILDLNAEDLISKRDLRRMDSASVYALLSARQALTSAGLKDYDASRAGVIIGTGLGGVESLLSQVHVIAERGPQRADPLLIPRFLADSPAALVSIDTGFQGPSISVAAACATGAVAVGEAFEMIRAGRIDMALCGATDAGIVREIMAGFCAIKALSRRNQDPEHASRPFDVSRDGFVISEGAAVLLIESEEHAAQRGARILAYLAGYGHTTDAFHITAPIESGDVAARAMILALRQAGVSPEDVDYVNAHGTSTVLNDITETKAIKRALGERALTVPVSSTKSCTGHLLGAAGSLEAAFCVLALRDGIIPPTINLEQPDPECDLDYVPNVARKADLHGVMSNSVGFGGHNTALFFIKP